VNKRRRDFHMSKTGFVSQMGNDSTIVLYGRSRTELDQLVAEFAGIFTNADGNLFVETYNWLNAYFATVLGRGSLNLRMRSGGT
jgi:hypothetical protein